jgi:hypothetical protein
MAQQTVNTVIVLRNDQTTNWESSSHVMLPGEVGIGYLENGNVIAKLGDGEHSWKDLPQIEGVFEDELTLTHDFGRYKTSNGFVKTNDAKGMTTSQWLIHALSETKEPVIKQPTASITASFTTASGETGAAISKINWDGSFTDGSYEYGSAQNTEANSKANTSVTWVIKQGDTIIGETQDGNTAYSGYLSDDTLEVALDAVATINVDSVYTPINNIGVETTGAITGFDVNGTKTLSFTPKASARGFRKMFVGNTTAESLDSSAIRALSLKSTEASTSAFEVTAPIGATNLVVACPTNSKGKNYTLSKAEMFTMSYEDYTDKFVAQAQVNVADARGGENGLQAYNIYVYSFTALKAATKFKITLKSVNV